MELGWTDGIIYYKYENGTRERELRLSMRFSNAPSAYSSEDHIVRVPVRISSVIKLWEKVAKMTRGNSYYNEKIFMNERFNLTEVKANAIINDEDHWMENQEYKEAKALWKTWTSYQKDLPLFELELTMIILIFACVNLFLSLLASIFYGLGSDNARFPAAIFLLASLGAMNHVNQSRSIRFGVGSNFQGKYFSSGYLTTFSIGYYLIQAAIAMAVVALANLVFVSQSNEKKSTF